jgi:hypothetical protein
VEVDGTGSWNRSLHDDTWDYTVRNWQVSLKFVLDTRQIVRQQEGLTRRSRPTFTPPYTLMAPTKMGKVGRKHKV